eukprot:TRINITY_DN760_c0_g3_i1.p1 TRINITY_DN760_c0_g3~~TRINITY_DN760_c0_g3_i1.p1  ORF type:complete len:455 (-),score=83.89 TRINITY_DN760_c0_g3_i1:90-1454(-)
MRRNIYQDSNIFGLKSDDDAYLSPDYYKETLKMSVKPKPHFNESHVYLSPGNEANEAMARSLRTPPTADFEPKYGQKTASQRKVEQFYGQEHWESPKGKQLASTWWTERKALATGSGDYAAEKRLSDWQSTIFSAEPFPARPTTARVDERSQDFLASELRRRNHNYSDLFGQPASIEPFESARKRDRFAVSRLSMDQVFQPQGYRQIKQRHLMGSLENPFYPNISERIDELRAPPQEKKQVAPGETSLHMEAAPYASSPTKRVQETPEISRREDRFLKESSKKVVSERPAGVECLGMTSGVRGSPTKLIERPLTSFEVSGLREEYDSFQLKKDLTAHGVQVVKLEEIFNTVDGRASGVATLDVRLAGSEDFERLTSLLSSRRLRISLRNENHRLRHSPYAAAANIAWNDSNITKENTRLTHNSAQQTTFDAKVLRQNDMASSAVFYSSVPKKLE